MRDVRRIFVAAFIMQTFGEQLSANPFAEVPDSAHKLIDKLANALPFHLVYLSNITLGQPANIRLSSASSIASRLPSQFLVLPASLYDAPNWITGCRERESEVFRSKSWQPPRFDLHDIAAQRSEYIRPCLNRAFQVHTSLGVDTPSKRVALITGAAGGIGAETAVELSRRGFEVILADRIAAEKVAERCKAASPLGLPALVPSLVDFSSMSSVRSFALNILELRPSLDVLILNAGTNTCPRGKNITEDGMNYIWQVNFLSQFFLLQLLLPALRSSSSPRLVTVSSKSHRDANTEWEVAATYSAGGGYGYAETKLAMAILAFEMHRRSDGFIKSFAVNPGSTYSNIWQAERWSNLRPLFKLAFLSVEQGCATSIAAATGDYQSPTYLSPYYVGSESFTLPWSGILDAWGPFVGANAAPPRELVRDPDVGRQLWRATWKRCEPYWPSGMARPRNLEA